MSLQTEIDIDLEYLRAKSILDRLFPAGKFVNSDDIDEQLIEMLNPLLFWP